MERKLLKKLELLWERLSTISEMVEEIGYEAGYASAVLNSDEAEKISIDMQKSQEILIKFEIAIQAVIRHANRHD